MMTLAAKLRLRGFRQSLRVRGRAMIADSGETMTAIVEERAALPDPTGEAQAQTPVFIVIHVEAGTFAKPREVATFAETVAGGRSYRVLEYDESASDEVTQKFVCEAQRERTLA